MRRQDLIGRTISRIETLPPDHFAGRPPVTSIILDDGTYIWPSSDEDGPRTVNVALIATDERGEDWVI